MKLRTSFLTRFLALALALVMLASSANLGLVARVFAAENGKPITDGALVAQNYDALSDAEKALLESGLLVGDTHEYSKPTDDDGLLTVDPVEKTVKAASFENWKAVSAWLETSNGEKEDIALDAEGNGTITGDHEAYTVFVTYELAIDVDTALQTTLLSTAGWLKDGIANIETIANAAGTLSAIELAMPELINLVENGYTVAGKNFGFEVYVKDAVKALNAQMTANGGYLNLTMMLDEYESVKVKYLLTKGTAFVAELETTTAHVESINTALTTALNVLGGLSGSGLVDENAVALVDQLNKMLTKWTAVAAPVIKADWTAAEKGTDLVKAGITDAEYAKLDTLVAALGAISDVTVSGAALKADSATVKFGASMSDVNLVAEIEYYENGEKKSKNWTGKVTLSDSEINEAKAKEEAEAKVYADLTAWAEGKLDLAQHFVRTDSYNEETLTYTIAYAPKLYTVTYDYQESEEVPYGAQITLPRHDNASKAYDYEVNGVAYAQGSVITVEGNTNITREEGKAYTTSDLLTVIVGNGYGNAKTNAILSSGALNDNETIAVRYPDANKGALADFKAGSDTVIAAKTYAADYKGLSWAPYKYVVDGGETKFFGGKTKVDAGAFKTSVEVYFRLTLDNYGAETTQKWMDLAVTLETEAQGQKAALDALAANHDQMGQLDKTKLGALNGVIDVTDFTPGDDNENDAETLRLRGVFKEIVGSMIANNLGSNNYLKIYNMLTDYKAGGLVYYYNNYETFMAEIDALSAYLNGLLEEEEALKIMVSAAGFPEYAEKITDLGTTLDDAKAALTAPNPVIDLHDTTKVATLVNALIMEGEAGTAKDVAAPYLDDNAPHTVNAKGYKSVTVTVKKGETGLSVSEQWTIEHVLTEADIDALKAKVDAKIAELLGADAAYYTGDYNSTDLDALVGVTVADLKKVAYEYEWTLKTVPITVPGMEGQSIDKNNATITLAPSTDPSVRYEYYLNGKKLDGSTYTFTAEELAALFDNDKENDPVITREEINLGAEAFEKFVKNLNSKIGREDAAVYKDGTLTVGITTSELQGFVMGLVMDSGYSYIGLGGESLVYMNEENTLEISIQTLMNAVLNESFSNATIIDLADGSGTLTTTTMELGNDAAAVSAYPFVLKLSGIPAEASKIAEILELGYIKLNGTSDHELNIELNLPEKLYQAYLTALIATGEVDLDNVAEVNNIIAVQFLWDYADGIITNDDITTETYTNTLKKLGKDIDLTKYENYYQKARTAIKEYLVVENGQASIDFVDDRGLLKRVMDKIMADSEMANMLSMIKEYDGGLEVSANVTVKGILNNYEALVLDNGNSSVTDKFDYVKEGELAGTKINGAAVVILLKDVAADLTFPATAILDLNGFALTGDVKSNGNLIIIDSDMDTFNGGSVNGDVSGTVTVIGGTYTDDVTAYLKDGYVQENGTVSNALYTIEADDAGNVTFKLNADIYRDVADGEIPSVKALAVDIAGDLLMNYFTAACLELEGQKIYGVALDDLLAILEGKGADGKIDALIEDVLNSVSAPGISNFVNAIIADVLDFKTISENIGKAPIATYKMVTAPWAVEINHVEDGNYLTVGIGYGDKSNDYTVSLEIVGDNRAINEVRELTTALAEIVTTTDVTVNIEQPTYNAGSNTFDVTGTAKAIVEIDLTQNENYTTVLAVILANGTGKTSYVDALNAGDMDALKDAVDATTITEVFTALKALSRDVSFAAMADKVGAEVTADAAALEAVYHIYLTAAGAVLDRFDVTGGNRTLGSFDSDDDGIYVADKEDIVRTGDAAAKGYTVNYNLSLTELSLTVKVFGEVEDEVAAIDILDAEGTVVATAETFIDALIALTENEAVAIRFNKEVVLDADYSFGLSFNIINAHNLDMNGKYFYINNLTVELGSDGELNVATEIEGYRAAYVDGVYKLVEFAAYVNTPVAATYYTKNVEDVRYLGVDLPIAGLTADELLPGVKIENVEGAVVSIELENYTDGSLVKTGQIMKVNIVENDRVVAFITYTVIVIGDANGNGMIDVGDAVAMQTIYTNNVEGKETEGITAAKLMAADANINDGVDVGDAVRVQTKWTLITESEDKEAAWAEWIAKLTAPVM